MLFDIYRREWSAELLADLDIPLAMLPEVRPTASRFGTTAVEHLGAAGPDYGCGRRSATPRCSGQACLEPGQAKNTYGTGSFVLFQTGAKPVSSDHGLLTTIGWQIGVDAPCYALEGSIFVSGSAIQWLRDGLGLIKRAPDVEALARSVPDTGGVVFVPALTGLGAPDWDAQARGLLIGLTRGNERRTHRPGRPRGDLLSDPRRDRQHDGRRTQRPDRAAGGWWRRLQRSAHADAGRPARRARHPARRSRDDGSRGRPPSAGSAPAATISTATGAASVAASAASNPGSPPTSATAATRHGAGRLERACGWDQTA